MNSASKQRNNMNTYVITFTDGTIHRLTAKSEAAALRCVPGGVESVRKLETYRIYATAYDGQK